MSAGWSILIIVFAGLVTITWVWVSGSSRIENMRRYRGRRRR